MEPRLDENGEDKDCDSYEECKKSYKQDPDDPSGMCNGCDHCMRSGDADYLLDRMRESEIKI